MTRLALPPRRLRPTSPSNWTSRRECPTSFQASAPELDEANAALARTKAFVQAQLRLAE